ncbi:MAG: type II toxin-antitoxin system Phd/YefM family antitoxin [Anaerolineales bacterium]|jgi:prevent-host-death family protein
MSTYNIHEAKTHFSKLLKRVLKGEEIVIAKAGKPIARILPIVNDVPRRIPGNDAGKIIIAPNFDDPLEEFDV